VPTEITEAGHAFETDMHFLITEVWRKTGVNIQTQRCPRIPVGKSEFRAGPFIHEYLMPIVVPSSGNRANGHLQDRSKHQLQELSKDFF